jgi:hypothetical protein
MSLEGFEPRLIDGACCPLDLEWHCCTCAPSPPAQPGPAAALQPSRPWVLPRCHRGAAARAAGVNPRAAGRRHRGRRRRAAAAAAPGRPGGRRSQSTTRSPAAVVVCHNALCGQSRPSGPRRCPAAPAAPRPPAAREPRLSLPVCRQYQGPALHPPRAVVFPQELPPTLKARPHLGAL